MRKLRSHLKSQLGYLKYVLRHKLYVMLECAKLGIPWQGLVHDLSKFSPEEWQAYVDKFYGSKIKTVESEKAFSEAWLHHQHCNPHHWQWWVQLKDPFTVHGSEIFPASRYTALPMPVNFIKEMLADWRAMARAFGDDSIHHWWKANEPKMILHPDTKGKLKAFMTFEELYGRSVQ